MNKYLYNHTTKNRRMFMKKLKNMHWTFVNFDNLRKIKGGVWKRYIIIITRIHTFIFVFCIFFLYK